MQAYHVLMPVAGTLERSPFAPVIETLVWGLRDLGLDASYGFGNWRADATNIVLCPNLLDAETRRRLPPETILYNMDQITPASPMPPSQLWNLRHWRIWDFSERNLAVWDSLGIAATFAPFGWYPGLDRVPGDVGQDIDVLFYGARNPRRDAAIAQFVKQGVRITVIDNVFGPRLDAVLARTKVVLNIHYYYSRILEMRVFYALANGKAVVSERAPQTEVPAVYEDAVRWSPYEHMAEACAALVADAEARAALGAAGRRAVERTLITPILKQALAGQPAVAP